MQKSFLIIISFLIFGCGESNDSQPAKNQDTMVALPLSVKVKTTGGEAIKLDDGSELMLPKGIFDSPVEVTFSRVNCEGIFKGSSFSSCKYAVDFDAEPKHRFEVNLVGKGKLNSKSDGEYKSVGVLHDQSALKTRVFALRQDEDNRCVDVEFTACGGDIKGSWELVNACGPRKEILEVFSSFNPDPYAVCGDGEWLREYPFTTTKRLKFDSTGDYEASGGMEVKERRILTQKCLDKVGETCNETCELSEGICTCLFDQTSGSSARGGSWAYSKTSTTTVVFDGPNAEEGEESGEGREEEYCVDGDTLTIHTKGRAAVFVYQRK